MLTFIAVLLRIVFNPLANVFQKRICFNGQSPLFANFLTYFGLTLIVSPFALNVSWTSLPLAFWQSAAIAGLLGALGNGFLVKAMQSGELSILGPINAWKSVVGIVFGFFMLREIPSLGGIAGIAFIIFGSYIVTGIRSGNLLSADLRYRFAAMILAAIEAIYIKKMILDSNVNTAFILWCCGGALFSFLFLPMQEKISWKHEWSNARTQSASYLLLIFSVGLMQLTTNYAFEKMPVGYALALFQLSSILSVIYGWIFFRESGILRKLSASIIMVFGSVLIILSR